MKNVEGPDYRTTGWYIVIRRPMRKIDTIQVIAIFYRIAVINTKARKMKNLKNSNRNANEEGTCSSLFYKQLIILTK